MQAAGPLTASYTAVTASAPATGIIGAPVRQLPSVFSTAAVTSSGSSPKSTGVSYISSVAYSRPAAAAAQQPRPSQLKEREGEDDEDDSEDEEGQQAPQVGPGGITRAEDAPKPPPGAEHPSMGSDEHEEGSCKRCCFYPRNRCLNGYNCEFCHYDHEKRKRKSKKKKKKDKDGTTVTQATVLSGGLPLEAPSGATVLSGMTSVAPSLLSVADRRPLVSTTMPTLQYTEGYSLPPAYMGMDLGQAQPLMSTAPYQVASTLAAPSYYAAATGSNGVVVSDNVQYLGTQPAIAATSYVNDWGMYGQQMQYQSDAIYTTGPPLHDASLLLSPFQTLATPAPQALQPRGLGLWAPPVEAPRLPHEIKDFMAPPPMEAPRAFPPTPGGTTVSILSAPPPQPSSIVPASTSTTTTAPRFAPPMSSPKLPKDVMLSLQQQSY